MIARGRSPAASPLAGAMTGQHANGANGIAELPFAGG